MKIIELIKNLEYLKDNHGDVDVTVWQYGGGLDDLCNVSPVYDVKYGLVVLETTLHESGARK